MSGENFTIKFLQMKILKIILLCLICHSCGNQIKSDRNTETKKQIVLSGVDNAHPNKKGMEWFLNNYKEEFIERNESPGVLKYQELIRSKYCFRTKSNSVTIFLIFCNKWEDARIVGDSIFLPADSIQNFCINGSVLIVVKGDDKRKVNDVLSHFAGNE